MLEYSKPKSAGQRPGNSGKNERRVRLPEPELFIERDDIDDVSETILPEKKTTGNSKSVGRYVYKKKVDWLVWLIFESRFRNVITEVLNTCYHSYPFKFKGRSNAISAFSLSVKIENLELHHF